jgi:hypothetical protein
VRKDADVSLKGRGKSESRWQNNILSFDTIPKQKVIGRGTTMVGLMKKGDEKVGVNRKAIGG